MNYELPLRTRAPIPVNYHKVQVRSLLVVRLLNTTLAGIVRIGRNCMHGRQGGRVGLYLAGSQRTTRGVPLTCRILTFGFTRRPRGSYEIRGRDCYSAGGTLVRPRRPHPEQYNGQPAEDIA